MHMPEENKMAIYMVYNPAKVNIIGGSSMGHLG